MVLDPVLVCKETHDTEVSQLRDEILKFLPYVSIITPNLAEAQLLLQKDIKTVEEMKQVAVALYDLGAKAVVIKGGNRLGGSEAVDVFYDGQGSGGAPVASAVRKQCGGRLYLCVQHCQSAFAGSRAFGGGQAVQGLCPCGD